MCAASLFATACAAPSPASTPAPSPLPPPTPTQDLVERGDSLTVAGERVTAERAYLDAVSLAPSDPEAYVRLASLYLEWNRADEGLAAATVAESLGAAPERTLPLVAALHAARGEWEQAIACAEAAVALNPESAQVGHLLTSGYLLQGRYAEADATLRVMVAQDPTDARAHERLGALLSPSDPELALTHLTTAGTPLALELVEILDNSDGDNLAYRLTQMGYACSQHGEWALSIPFLEQAISLDPEYAEPHLLLGQAKRQLGNQEEARGHFEEAVRLTPGSPLAHSLLGLDMLWSGEAALARSHLEKAYDLDTQSPAACLNLAYLYSELGYYAAAEIWIREALSLGQEELATWQAATHYYLSRDLVGPGQGGETAQRMVTLAPKNAAAHVQLGWARFLQGDGEAAERSLMAAIELDPALASAYYRLGQLYSFQGRLEEAERALERALNLNTDPSLRLQIEQDLGVLR